jgi:hypothetical protein
MLYFRVLFTARVDLFTPSFYAPSVCTATTLSISAHNKQAASTSKSLLKHSLFSHTTHHTSRTSRTHTHKTNPSHLSDTHHTNTTLHYITTMPPYDSSHLLPLNSMIFSSMPRLLATLGTNPTLVDLQHPAEQSITALPAAPRPSARKRGFWQRVGEWMRGVVLCGGKEVQTGARLADVGAEGGGE